MSGFVPGPSNGKRRGGMDRRASSSASPRPRKTRKVSDEAFVAASASESDEIEELSPNNAISGPGPGTLRYREERARQAEEVALEDPTAASGEDFDDPFCRSQSRSSDISPDVQQRLEGPSKVEGQLQAVPWKQEKRVSTLKHYFPRRVISTDSFDEEGTDAWEGISAVRQSLIPVEKAVQVNSVPNGIEGKGGGTGTPGTSIEHAIPIDENVEDVAQIPNAIHSTSSVSKTKSSKGGAEEDPIEDSDHEKEELDELDGIPMHPPTVGRNGFRRHAISEALSPSVPSGKVKDMRQIWETFSKSTAPPSSAPLPVYGQHSSTKTPIPVPQSGSRGPAASGFRSQQKLSRSMGTREDSTNPTSNSSATSSAIKARGKPVSASRKSKADPDSLLPIKKMYCCGKAFESMSDTPSQQYFLQWSPNSLYITDQARLEAASFPISRRLGKADRYTFLWTDLRDVECSKTLGVIPTILSFRLQDEIRDKLGLQEENDKFVIEFDLDHEGWNDQGYGRMKARLRSTPGLGTREVDQSGSVAVLESARLQMEPFATEDENALASSALEFGTGVQLQAGASAPKGSKTPSESAKPAPLRLRDRAARSRMEDRSTDSDEAKSRAESDGISSTTREDGAELRRSRRQRAAAPAVNVNDNELLFSYPPVNITRGDLCRLEPDEFLNDTLIEFGLKLWQNDLKEKDPRLADDIWVFNSFFYKKLSNRKLEGYSSVQKWTAKVDIFKKKFIVVPINENLHWYLAVIYRPGASLYPVTQPQAPATSPMTRASLKQAIQTRSRPVKSASPSPPPEMEAASVPNTDVEDSMEVDQELLGGNDALKSPTEARGPSSPSVAEPLTNMDVDELEEGVAADDEGDVEMSSRFPEHPSAEASFRTPDAEGPRGLLDYASPDEEPNHGVPRPPRPPDLTQIAEGVSLRADTSSDDISLDGDPRLVDDGTKLTGPEPQSMGQGEQTHIFILDSLGSKHPSVFNTLREWLSLEAEHKRKEKIPKAAAASGKYVKVPYQPNHVDCGVYLLHFAETFVAKADEIITLTLNTRKMDDASLRDKIFDKDVLKKKRAMLKDRVIEMAKAWKAPHSEAVPISTEKSPLVPDATSHQPESKTGLAKAGVAQQSSVIEVPAETVSEGPSDPEKGDEPAGGITNDPSPFDSAIGPTSDTDGGKQQQKLPPGIPGPPEPTEESDDEIQFIGHHKPAQQARTKPSRTASTKAKLARHKG
ncbi:hypothetical protein FRC05_010024 [Tulasnella sp. 425]|nr:hypothetical protein FRC05_010024 [Tulasnella sp. 425]